MKKTLRRKLLIDKETLRTLSPSMLVQIAAGITGYPRCESEMNPPEPTRPACVPCSGGPMCSIAVC